MLGNKGLVLIFILYMCTMHTVDAKTEEEKRRRNSLRQQRRAMRAAKKKNASQAINVIVHQISMDGDIVEATNEDMLGYDVLDRKMLRGLRHVSGPTSQDVHRDSSLTTTTTVESHQSLRHM
uniref:Subtilisin n=1 Tax=Aureoumbra lagunensis TaxID=44058 RepID=A0A7S3K063_9STRA|mmetsp:Transcript_8151/g.11353  ORF Transcript_8151/g.11353 Transcript_8151/m.11353 type:complete len:122 (-) Transcript_8151:81-446(-)